MRYKTNLFSILESASVELQMVLKSFPSHYHRFQTMSFFSQEHHGTPPSWYFGLCSLNQLRYTETVCCLNILGIVTNNHAKVEAFSMANKKVISHETWKFEPKKRPFQVPLKSGLKSMVSALECNFQNFFFKSTLWAFRKPIRWLSKSHILGKASISLQNSKKTLKFATCVWNQHPVDFN